MKLPTTFILILLLLIGKTLKAQEFQLFEMMEQIRPDSTRVGFVSLSDICPMSEHPDSLILPELTDWDPAQTGNFNYFHLDSCYRERFLEATQLNKKDRLFLYSYGENQLLTLDIKHIRVGAYLSVYAEGQPQSPSDYQIGFEIEESYLNGFEPYFSTTLVAIGNKNPFVENAVRQIHWNPTDTNNFPGTIVPEFNAPYVGVCHPGKTYISANFGYNYFIQEYLDHKMNEVAIAHLVITDSKTNSIVFQQFYEHDEGASIADRTYQWTGQLFRNKPPVIFGMQWHSFDCPEITVIGRNQPGIPIHCDNRH